MMVEEWKPIKGYEGLYEVSTQGNVRSLDRFIRQKDSHGGVMTKRYFGKQIVPTDNGNGYLIVTLRKDGRRSKYVHRLVAETFIDNPRSFPVVNHIDFDKANNSVDNLEWTTQMENVHHSVDRMRKPRKRYKQTKTGEKYITERNGRWRFSIRTKSGVCFDREYHSLEEAKAAREVVIGGGKHYAG